MLDVHPPHHAAHTWKDFFIHIATIVIGLLIAVGLEQTVEYFHRQHERHLLEHELHAEAMILQRNAEIDIVQYDSQLKFLLAQRKDLGLIIASNGKLELPLRKYVAPIRGHEVPGRGTIQLLNPIWESARADGRLALLPEGFKRAYGVVSYRINSWNTLENDARVAGRKSSAFLFQFSDPRTPTTLDLSRMSEAQLVELRALLTDDFDTVLALRRDMVSLSGEVNLVLGDELIDQQALSPAVSQVVKEARMAHPEDFARMVDEIDAEDGTPDKAVAKSTRTN